ncbi:MAG: right-handed parallel beta-helix repeat-containing protein [Candidatus Marinimicrobia bacterium]|nr:right-handed parallel beta-helix repeat-containing protein [Candidatus Neomarinimicrobiota bacterium]
MRRFIFIFTLIIGFSGALLADTIVVDLAGGGDYTTIHGAVAAAADGDTILVMSGTYIISSADGGIVINDELHMLGSGYDLPENGGTYIQSATSVFDFQAGADGSTMRGFRIFGYGAPMINIAADDMIIEENYLTNSYDQGWLINFVAGASADTVRNNIIGSVSPTYRVGLSINQTVDLTVCNNIFFGFSWLGGLYPQSTTNTLIVNNLFVSNAQSLYYNDSGSTIVNNIFMNGGTQITAQGGSPSISYNCFFNNTSNGSTGIAPILENPDFVDYTPNDVYDTDSYDQDNYNFHLQTVSPCINRGNPLFDYFDLDGSRNDLGVYGWKFPIGTTGAPTIPVVNSISVSPATVSPSGTITINATGRIGE